MIVRTIIAAALSAYAFFLVMRHNMHMFQLNGYHYDEHIRWIRKNLRQQWLIIFGMALGVARLFFPNLALDLLIYVTLLLEIAVYRALRRLNTKKKLAFTPRVKRMMATIIILSAIALSLVGYFGGMERLPGACMLLVSAQIFMVIIANFINHPLEWAIGRYYINDAKRILKGMPDLKVIGITGSYGKTSMKSYLLTLLQSKYNVLATPGNFNTPLGVTITVRQYLKPTHEIFLCEMGARHVGEIKDVCDIAHPDMGIITSIGPQHLETFLSMENIQKTKFELADAIAGKGPIFLNGDNEYINEKAGEYRNKVFYYAYEKHRENLENARDIGENSEDFIDTSESPSAQGNPSAQDGYYAKDITLSQYGTEFTAVAPNGESERFQMKLIGGHNVINVMGAIAVAHSLGISLKDMRIPIRRLESVEHRMQMREQGAVTIIDDAYNSNPVGSKAAVNTLAMFDGTKILITPGMVELGDKEEEYNYEFGVSAASCCDYMLLIGSRHTQPIREGALSQGFPEDKCLSYERLEDAMAYAYGIKDKGHKYILLENDLPDNY